MKIRVMNISDYEQIYQLWLSCKGMGLNNLDDSKEGIERFLNRNPETCFVAESEQTIIGVIIAGNDGRRGYIYHTAVNPDYRHQGIATKLVNELKEVEKEAVKNKKGEAPTVAIIFGGGENFMLATETSYLGDLAKTVGAKNITSNLDTNVKSPYIQFSLEQILEQNPDYILRFAHGEIEQTKKAFDTAFDKNPAYKELDAVKNNKVIDLDPSIFNVSANLQVKEAIKTLGETFYGK